MHSQQVSINLYALAIRKLAAAHQTGKDLSDVKHQVPFLHALVAPENIYLTQTFSGTKNNKKKKTKESK